METLKQAQVVVVGAGPTGLMLAGELKLMGVDVVVIERRPTGTAGESRAPGINARTMEVFGQRGFANRFFERGRRMPAVLISGIMTMPGMLQPGWPDALILPQHETERLLAERADELGAEIIWSTELIYYVQNNHGVEIIVSQGGELKRLEASYIVGCDGGHSVVRRVSGVRTVGDDPQSHWIVADAKLDSPPGDRESFGRNTRVGTYQVSKAEPGWHRISLMKITPPEDRSAAPTLAELRQALLDGLGTDFGLREARWISRFTDGFRQVDGYRQGRAFLAGDAGHTHAPIGGQGLNLGVQDGVNLAWKLAAVLLHEAPDSLLDSYNDERHPVASAVLQLSRAQTAMIKPGRQIDALREFVGGMIERPEITLEYAGILSGLSLRYSWGEGLHPLVGRRMPNLALAATERDTDVFAFLHAGHPLLLVFGDNLELEVPDKWQSRVTRVTASLRDQSGTTWTLPVLGEIPAVVAALVRPDGYVAWVQQTGDNPDNGALVGALERWLG